LIGTGFLFGEKYILTCNHVVKNSNDDIKVVFTSINSKILLNARIVVNGNNLGLDCAILEITEEKPKNVDSLRFVNTSLDAIPLDISVIVSGHPVSPNLEKDLQNTVIHSSKNDVTLKSRFDNGFWLCKNQNNNSVDVIREGYSGSPVWNYKTGEILGILNMTDANQNTGREEGAIGTMVRSDAIKTSLKKYDEQHETSFCDLLFTREEAIDTSYIKDNCTEDIQNLAGGLNTTIFFIGSEINLYKRNENLNTEELNSICDLDHQFNVNGDQNRSLSEIELAYFLDKQIRKELKRRGRLIKCLQAEIPELKGQAIDQHSPCPSCPYELSKRPENCLFRLENDNQDQTNNQLSIEEQLMNAQVNVQFLSQYYINLCGNRLRVIYEIEKFYDRSQPNEAHKLIAKYVKNGKMKLIITTNCDSLLERAFNSSPTNIEDYGVYGLPKNAIKSGEGPLTCIKEPVYPDAPIILKLHGCYNTRDATKALITRTDFLSYYSISLCNNFNDSITQIGKIYRRAISEIEGCNIWFIGYTLSDHEINTLMPILLNDLPDTVCWISKPNSILSQTNNVWKNDNRIKLVLRTLDAFFNELEYFCQPQKN
jgi:hypothetical protein